MKQAAAVMQVDRSAAATHRHKLGTVPSFRVFFALCSRLVNTLGTREVWPLFGFRRKGRMLGV